LTDYADGRCDECPTREECEAYSLVSSMYPKDDPEAMTATDEITDE